ncbi:MAG TPA: hypothetical protein IGS17_19785 [Oscillatoriales cyanobacterium M59_W2019_021]|nr:MAG: hypothetical protein D6728_02360 [Cyanobacteria bacterium J055]HIK29839.1 hypothetical protein [Oscillatoriales cyanobacterium M4454_W2019_049]HIK53133.1 hypothetical protein [Oscillatoriales cyanobacterium M59_W2019_021]
MQDSGNGDMAQMNHEGDAGSDSHMEHGNDEATPHHHSSGNSEGSVTTTQAKLTVPAEIAPDRSIPLEILITDAEKKLISQFDIFQEKLLHAIAVSNDLQFYNHIHPDYQGNGKFTTNIAFPKPGDYTIFLDYKPAGEAERVSLVTVSVPGTTEATPQPDFTREKTIDDTKVELTLDAPTLKENEDVMLQFTLKDASGNPVELQPYLGERGHLVIVKKGDLLTESSYLHSHAMKESPAGQVQFHTQFPESGQYKMWGQFNRNGQIVTADFWVNVE